MTKGRNYDMLSHNHQIKSKKKSRNQELNSQNYDSNNRDKKNYDIQSRYQVIKKSMTKGRR